VLARKSDNVNAPCLASPGGSATGDARSAAQSGRHHRDESERREEGGVTGIVARCQGCRQRENSGGKSDFARAETRLMATMRTHAVEKRVVQAASRT